MKFIPSAPISHPRYLSLYYRDLLSWGVKVGITSLQGLTAHGRGEAFDYLLGEMTHSFSLRAIKSAAAMLITANRPVISVNGNTAILAAEEFIGLSRILPAQLEVNIFHKSKLRERKIAAYLKKKGAEDILLPDKSLITGLSSNRKFISRKGQKAADVIFVPLEDGDRTEHLLAMGKKVITVDLNPLSRTAQKATVTIVDNLIRSLPLLIKEIIRLKKSSISHRNKIVENYDNRKSIQEAIEMINRRLTLLADKKAT